MTSKLKVSTFIGFHGSWANTAWYDSKLKPNEKRNLELRFLCQPRNTLILQLPANQLQLRQYVNSIYKFTLNKSSTNTNQPLFNRLEVKHSKFSLSSEPEKQPRELHYADVQLWSKQHSSVLFLWAHLQRNDSSLTMFSPPCWPLRKT